MPKENNLETSGFNKGLLSRNIVNFKGDDTMMKDDLLEIYVTCGLVSVKRELWRSWTGRRFVNGDEHHGPIFVMGSEEKYIGERTCNCSLCQPDMKAELKPN